MTTPLAAYVTTMMGDRTLREVATSGVSRSTLHQIVTGATTKPNPDTLALLARYFGDTDVERSEIYAMMMALSGYFDWLATLAEEATTPAQQEFAGRLASLKKYDPVQFALYYHAALTLARLQEKA
jgi:hypothetical protein